MMMSKNEKEHGNGVKEEKLPDAVEKPCLEEEVCTEEIVKKSTLQCRTAFDLQKLSIPLPVFIPMTCEERPEDVCCTYYMTGLKSISELEREDKGVQYQFLVNFAKLYDAWKSYNIPLTVDNIYYDENFLPYVKTRDLYEQGKVVKDVDFLATYKIFIGGILGQKYGVEQLLESGLEALKDEPSFEEFYKATSNEELVWILRQRKNNYIKNQKETRVWVPKNSARVKSILSIVAPVLLVILIGLFTYNNLLVIPHQERIIAANEAYIRRDFVGVIDSLHGIPTEDMSVNTKYILAVSFARGQSLRQEELTRIVSRLTVQSNVRELEYWIYLGRLDVERAQDLAMSLGDNQLLMYAYMMELNILENDTTIPGHEKQGRISELENSIRRLGERYLSVELEEEEDIEEEVQEEIEREEYNEDDHDQDAENEEEEHRENLEDDEVNGDEE